MIKKKLNIRIICIFIILIMALVWLQYKFWIENNSIERLLQLKQDIKNQQEENVNLQLRNQALQAEVYQLKNNSQSMIDHARWQLGMVQPDETFYRIIAPEDD